MTTATSARSGSDGRPAPSFVLRTTGLSKHYGPTIAVVGLDLELRDAEVVGFLGPNGAGKTTVLRMLSGSLRPTSGTAELLGRDPWRDGVDLHRQIGYLPGDLRLPLRLTGRQLLAMYDRLRGGTAVRLPELAERLAAPLDVPLHALSKGNRQKLGIVQAFMSEPRLLLLDEPTSGLDPLAQEVFDALVREVVAQGTTVLLSSHVLAEVDRVADRVAMLRRGRLVAVERLEDLRAAAPHRVKVRVRSGFAAVDFQVLPGVRDVFAHGEQVSFTATTACLDAVVKLLATFELADVSIEPADLEALFLSYYEGDDGDG